MKHKIISIFILVSFFMTGLNQPFPVYAQDFVLPKPGVMVHLSLPSNPPMLKGIKVHPNNPFRFDFILDQGDIKQTVETQHAASLQEQSTRLIKYFLASLTIPEKDLWVNLSPYEKDRIIPESFGQTEMGRDLLAQDYLLKQITASLMYPEDKLGKKFWKRIYEEAQKKYGNTNIPVNTFNKVWIVPEKAIVYENAKAGTAYIVESKLKVMLEEDYLATTKNQSQFKFRQPGDMFQKEHQNVSSSTLPTSQPLQMKAPQVNPRSPNETPTQGLPTRGHVQKEHQNVSSSTLPSELPTNVKASQVNPQSPNEFTSQIIREIIIPELTKEVNEGKNFTQLRQVYNSLILATWYKKKIKDSILSQVYADQNKVAGINIDDPKEKDKIYQQYLQAFKKGVYNYIKEEAFTTTEGKQPRKYFSGGLTLNMNQAMVVTFDERIISKEHINRDMVVNVKINSLDPAMSISAEDWNQAMKADVRPSKEQKELERKRHFVQYVMAGAGLLKAKELAYASTIYPVVYMPKGIENPDVEIDNLFQDSYTELNGPDGVYQHILPDRMPFLPDYMESHGDYLATIDRDNQGRPYRFINFNEFAIHAYGYNRPEIIQAFLNNPYEVINRTAYSDFITPAYAAYLRAMMSIKPVGMEKVLIVNSGAEANENAIKAAKLKRPASEFMISFSKGFHGRTTGALSLTPKPKVSEGFFKFDWPKVDFPDETEKSQNASLKHLWTIFTSGNKDAQAIGPSEVFLNVLQEIVQLQNQFESGETNVQGLTQGLNEIKKSLPQELFVNASKVTGVIIEPYQGEGGINFTQPRFFQVLRYLTILFDIPLIFDEIQSGFFVTGKTWAHENFNLAIPSDMMTSSKKTQMGVLYMNRKYFVDEPGKLNSTWGGSDSGILRAVEYEKIVRNQQSVRRINELGQYALGKLKDLEKRHGWFLNARGLGLVLAIDLQDSQKRDRVVDAAFRRGLIVNAAGLRTIRILPRFDTFTYTIDEAFKILEKSIEIADGAMKAEKLEILPKNAERAMSVIAGKNILIGDDEQEAIKQFSDNVEIAKRNEGGVDLTSNNFLQIQNADQGIKFYIEPAKLEQLRNTPGFIPVIINISPMTNLREFLGLGI